jgi:hypothetical protein
MVARAIAPSSAMPPERFAARTAKAQWALRPTQDSSSTNFFARDQIAAGYP